METRARVKNFSRSLSLTVFLSTFVAANAQELQVGTSISIRLIDSVNSKTDEAGQIYRATVDDDVKSGRTTVIPKGSDAAVQLISGKSSKRLAGRGSVTLALRSITTRGKTFSVYSDTVTSVSKPKSLG